MIPVKRKNKWGRKSNQDSSAFSVGCGKGMINGSPFESTYASLSKFNGATDTGRFKMSSIGRRKVMNHGYKKGTFQEFTEKAVRLGIDLRKVGHT